MTDIAYEIALNPKCDEHQRGLANNSFDKETGSGARLTRKVGVHVNELLAQELHKPVIKNVYKKKNLHEV